MGLTVTLGGVDITALVDESSIQIKDSLASGAGSGGYALGRNSSCSFKTSLGPMTNAPGAGSPIFSPSLLRQGEVKIFDGSGTYIFGGFAGKLTDKTEATTNYTQIDCYDYWQQLDRIIITDTFINAWDVDIIRFIAANYVPWLDVSQLPVTGSYRFAAKVFKNISAQQALAELTKATGYLLWVDPNGQIHYVNPLDALPAPFALSTQPDFYRSFPFAVDSYEIDDNAAITRVTLYGGKRPSQDFIQDLSAQANGKNKAFLLAFYPRRTTEGSIKVRLNSVELILGYDTGGGEENQLKSQGGKADCLVNPASQVLIFDVAPASGADVNISYRYQFPLVVRIEDEEAFLFYGQHLDGVISDDTIFDSSVAVAKCQVLLKEQSRGLTHLKVKCWKSGLQSGQILRVFHSVRDINASYLIQEVEYKPLGGGNYEYYITLGAWQWDLVDIIMSLTRSATSQPPPAPDDENQDIKIDVIQARDKNKLLLTTTASKTTFFSGGIFYARSTPVGDGHDAYPGRCYLA